MDFGAVLLELHFVHQLIDQVDAAAVVGKDVFAAAGIGNGEGIEATARIVHDDQHTPLLVATYAALDLLGGIVLAAMNDSVGQRLAQRGFDLKFFAGGTFQLARHLHDAVHHRTDGPGIGVESASADGGHFV